MDSYILKSKNDKRNYKYIELDNKLKVLLINSDNTTCSASMYVGTGSYDEPVEGLAHFLEHMLFMGSEKYPLESDYQTFIANNGGNTNAYTSGDSTCYYFGSLSKSVFKEALDIFAHFFIDPLLSKDGIKREMNAVDSEHKKNINNNVWRKRMMIGECCLKGNPLGRFTCGSLETLNIPNIYELLLKFYNENYSANIMRLVILGPQSLEKLEEYAKSSFSAIKNKDKNIIRDFDQIIDYDILIEQVPLSKKHALTILWDVPNYDKKIKLKPFDFITYLLCNEGRNSLVQYLINNGFIYTVNGGFIEKIGTRGIYTFDIDLTDKGFNEYEKVYKIVYMYIDKIKDFLKDPKKVKEYYEQMKFLSEKTFEEYTIDDETEYINYLSSTWKNVNVKHILSKDLLYPTFKDKYIDIYNEILNNFKKDSIIISSDTFKNKTTKVEKWFGIEYNKYDKSLDKNYDKLIEISKEISIPQLNKFIVKQPSKILVQKAMEYPIKIGENIYWKFDNNLPQVNIMLSITYPNINKSALSYLEFIVYQHYTRFYLRPIIFEMEEAGIKIEKTIRKNKVLIDIIADSHIIKDILKIILKKIDISNKNMFESVIKYVKSTLIDEDTNPPYVKVKTMIKKYLEKDFYDDNDLLKVFDNIKYDNINKEYEMNDINCLIQGNIIDCSEIIKLIPQVNTTKIAEVNLINKTITKLIKQSNDNNSILCITYNIGYITPNIPDWKKQMNIIDLFNMYINKLFFDDLRTRQQLGYITRSGFKKFGEITNPFYVQFFLVQSPEYSCNILQERIEEFIKGLERKIKLSSVEFNVLRESLINNINKKIDTLNKNTLENFEIILRYNSIFDLKKQLIENINTLTPDNLYEFYKKTFIPENKNIFGIKSNKEM